MKERVGDPQDRLIDFVKDHIIEDGQLEFSSDEEREEACRVIRWRATNVGSGRFVGTVRLRIALPPRFTAPWFMAPGYFYGENRRADQWVSKGSKLYPRFDPATRVPGEMTSAWWDFPADRAASPLIYVHQDDACFAVASDPHYAVRGDAVADDPEPQVGVGFGHDGRAGYIRFTIPACEEPFTYTNSPRIAPTIRRITLPPGARISGRLCIYEFQGDRHGYQRVMEDYSPRLGRTHPAAGAPETSALLANAIHGMVAGHYHAAGNYFIYSRPYSPVDEQIANARGATLEWHQMNTGFVNGFLVCRALLRASVLTGHGEARDVAVRVADRICREGLSPSGLFWADFMPEKVVTPNGTFPNPLFKDRREWGTGWIRHLHSRTIADACDHLAGMILDEERHHPEAPSLPLWKRALAGNLRAALELQMENGSYGQHYDPERRAVVRQDGCGGLLWIPAMIKACAMGLGGGSMAAAMKSSLARAAEAYAPFLEREYIWGAPEDNDSPTSEDGMNAVMAYCDLYGFTGEPRYLRLARIAADWLLTFHKTYNQIMPKDSLLGIYGLRSRGGEYASTSNNMMHVFGCLCIRHLCALSRWTGNPYYRQCAQDHWGYAGQQLNRAEGMFNGPRGAMAEQFYWCDWGSWGRWRTPTHHHQKGCMAPFTAIWCIAVAALGASAAREDFEEPQGYGSPKVPRRPGGTVERGAGHRTMD